MSRLWSCHMDDMTKAQMIAIAVLRIGLGTAFLYAGLSKLLDPVWTAEARDLTQRIVSP